MTLRAQVFAYGYIDHDDTEDKQWGCAAHALGMLDGILKIIYGRWVRPGGVRALHEKV